MKNGKLTERRSTTQRHRSRPHSRHGITSRVKRSGVWQAGTSAAKASMQEIARRTKSVTRHLPARSWPLMAMALAGVVVVGGLITVVAIRTVARKEASRSMLIFRKA